MNTIAARSKRISALSGVCFLFCSFATQANMQVPDSLPLSVVTYYTFAVTLVVIYSLVMGIARSWSWLAYSGYGMLMLILVGAMDGTIAYLINGTNWIMIEAPLFIASITIAYGFTHVAVRIPEAH